MVFKTSHEKWRLSKTGNNLSVFFLDFKWNKLIHITHDTFKNGSASNSLTYFEHPSHDGFPLIFTAEGTIILFRIIALMYNSIPREIKNTIYFIKV